MRFYGDVAAWRPGREIAGMSASYLRDHREVLDALCDSVAELGDAPPTHRLALR
jgi:hypothetical protein